MIWKKDELFSVRRSKREENKNESESLSKKKV
jgi:hypothetical protein